MLPVYSAATTENGSVAVHFARHYDLKVASIVERFGVVKPTLFLGVPRVWEKIQDKLTKTVKAMVDSGELKGAKLKIGAKGKQAGVTHARASQLSGTGAKPCCYNFFEKKVHAATKAKLGLEHVKFAFTGAAPISVETRGPTLGAFDSYS